MDDLKAILDRLGAIQAAAVLFPAATREIIQPAYHAGKLTIGEIARLVGIPDRYVAFVLSDHWPPIYQKLLAIS